MAAAVANVSSFSDEVSSIISGRGGEKSERAEEPSLSAGRGDGIGDVFVEGGADNEENGRINRFTGPTLV